MEEILQQLRSVVYPIIIYRILYIPGGCWGFLNHQQYGSSPIFIPLLLFRSSIFKKKHNEHPHEAEEK